MIALIMSFITWFLMVWFVWLFYGALRSINKIDDNLVKIADNLEALDDISECMHEIMHSYVAPKQMMLSRKNRVVSHSEQELAEKEKKGKKEL